ncbi:hypothetical protein ACFOLC_06605 [Lysobacter cavernae]|uniref:Uncharacterized protein n=1 Tax=Lysobacter cavernae TaxID=1685901 RepID=A0ABV7RM52_9GAMM
MKQLTHISLTARMRIALALLWMLLLVLAGWAVSQRLELSGDLRKFMPAHDTSGRAEKPDAAPAANETSAAAFRS